MHNKILELNEAITKLHKVTSVYAAISEYAEKENRPGIEPHYAVLAIEKILLETKLSEKLKPFEYEGITNGE